MTRLERSDGEKRVVVGYDQDLATYYVEAGPPSLDPDDPDEGLVTVRGRAEADLPDLDALLHAVRLHGVTLEPADQRRLVETADCLRRTTSAAPQRRTR